MTNFMGEHEKCTNWRQKFEEHLNDKGNVNSKSEASLPFKILSAYYENFEEISLETLLDPLETNKILKKFKDLQNMNSTTKHKYISFYRMFVNFLALDVCSPEYVCDEPRQALEAKNFKLNRVLNEIDKTRSYLSKYRGIDIMACRERTKKKVLTHVQLYNAKEGENEKAEIYDGLSEGELKEMSA